jgi:hypothetical protein
MNAEPKEMRELHEVRARLSREQKGWSAQKIIEFYRQEADKAAREFGLHLKRQPRRQPHLKAVGRFLGL